MRILYVTHQYPPAIGGSEKYVGDLSQELAARGHHVDVYASRSRDYASWKNELAPREQANGVNVVRFRSLRRGALAWRILAWSQQRYLRTGSRFYLPFVLYGGGPICPGMYAALLARLQGYDLVHLNTLVYSHSAYAYQAARWRRVPCVVSPHIEIEQAVTYGYDYQLNILRCCDHVLADTEGERDFAVGLGVPAWRVTTSGCGVREQDYPQQDRDACRQRLGLPRDAFVVLFLGRQVAYKGLEATLQACSLLRRRRPAVYLVVAGPETEFSRQLFARWGERPGVLNLGRVPDEVRLDALYACDCMALPSAGEAFGIVYLEAWMAGKPVIGVRTPAVSTVIEDGVDGWLVPSSDPLALAQVIDRWVQAPQLARQMGAQGRTKALSRYTVSRVADVVEGVYARVLRARRRVSGQQHLCEF